MNIDEEKKWSLTNFRGKKAKKPAVKSDHNVLKASFNIKFKVSRPSRGQTVYNFKNKSAMKRFSDLTSKKDLFTKYFANDKDFLVQVRQWERELRRTLSRCFKKVRVGKKSRTNHQSKVNSLLEKR